MCSECVYLHLKVFIVLISKKELCFRIQCKIYPVYCVLHLSHIPAQLNYSSTWIIHLEAPEVLQKLLGYTEVHGSLWGLVAIVRWRSISINCNTQALILKHCAIKDKGGNSAAACWDARTLWVYRPTANKHSSLGNAQRGGRSETGGHRISLNNPCINVSNLCLNQTVFFQKDPALIEGLQVKEISQSLGYLNGYLFLLLKLYVLILV